jgi:uncharacterized membrane protein (DUF485 family)
MTIPAIIIAFILLVIAYILLSPVSIYICYDFDHKNVSTAGVKIFPFSFKLKTGKPKEKTTKTKKPPKPAKRKKKSGKRGTDFFPILIDNFEMFKKIIVDFVVLIIGILKSPDRFFADVNLGGGLGEPDLTGQLYGGIQMIKPALGNSMLISYSPDFMAESLSGRATVGLVVRIGNILKELLIFVWRLPKLKLIKIYRKIK